MNNDDLVTLVKAEITEAVGYESDVLASNRKKALDAYFGRMDDAPEGNSQIVSTDVADTIHALMAQASGIFQASSVEFDAMNEQDEPQCQLESDVITYLIEKNDEWATFDAANFDALLQANGWIKVKVDVNEVVTRESYEQLTIEQSLVVIQPNAQNQTVTTENEIDHGDGLVSFDVIRTTRDAKLKIKCISPDLMIFSPAADQFNLDEVRLVAERRLYTVSDLIEMGVNKDDAMAMPGYEQGSWPAIIAREAEYSETTETNDGKQPASELKETYICYILIDENGDGITERRRIHIGGSTLIDNSPAKYVPYVTGSPLPVPHRIQGQGIYDIQGEVQKTKTGILRQYMDNLRVQNKSRVGYIRGEVNMDELLSGRINGAVGMDRPESLFNLASNNIGAECIQGLNYMDTVRSARGGASLDMQSGQMQVAHTSAMAAAREYDSKEIMAGYYCKNLAQTLLKNTFLLVHKVMREDWEGPIDAKLKGKWTQTDPRQWPERQTAKVTVGMTTGEKQSRIAGLTELISTQSSWLLNGMEGILTDKGKLYNAAADWIRTAGLSANPEEYIVDPNSEEANATVQQKAQEQQQHEAMVRQQSEQLQNIQIMLERMKDETDRWQTQVETRFKYYDANLKAEVKEAELTTQAIEKTLQPEPMTAEPATDDV